MSNNRLKAWIISLFVVFLWSTSIVMIRIESDGIPAITFAGYRYLIASATLVTLWCIRRKRIFFEKAHFKDLAILGFLGYFMSQGLLYVGIYHLTIATVTIILNLMPIFAILFSLRTKNELPSSFQFISIVLCMVGVVIFFWYDAVEYKSLIGIGAMTLSSASWALYTIQMRKAASSIKDMDYLEYTAFPMLIGSVMMLLYSASKGEIIAIQHRYVGTLLWLAIINTSIAFLLWNMMHKYLKAFEVSMSHNTMLFQGSALAYVGMGESLSFTNMLGMGIIFISLTLLETGEKLKTSFNSSVKRILKHV